MLGELDVPTLRANFREFAVRRYPMATDCELVPGAALAPSVERIRPPVAHPCRHVIYLHGGGYVLGAPETHRALAAEIGRSAEATVSSVHYRTAPEHPFPAAVDDVRSIYRELLADGLDPSTTLIAGDSAGAGLALAAAMQIRDDGLPLPAALALLSPWADLTCSNRSYEENRGRDRVVDGDLLRSLAELYLDGADARCPLASPVFGSFSGLPPMLVQAGSHEILVDDARTVAHRARSAGVELELELWPGMEHVWHLAVGDFPAAAAAVRGVADHFLRALAPVASDRR